MYIINLSNKHKFNIGLNIILLICATLGGLILKNKAVIFFTLLFYVFGFVIINLYNINRDKTKLFSLFSIFYICYYIYAFFINYYYLKDPASDYFVTYDSIKFYTSINEIVNLKTDYLIGLAKVLKNPTFNDCKGFGVLSYTIGYSANCIDENTLFIQQIPIICFSAGIIPVIYKIARPYVNPNKIFALAAIYGIFSWTSFYSAMFIRDIHIAYIYCLTFELLCRQKLRMMYAAYLMILGIGAWSLRPENGYFFSVFLIYFFLKYYNFNFTNNKTVVLLLVGIFALISLPNLVNEFLDTYDLYFKLAREAAPVHTLNAARYELPIYLRLPINIIHSQISPFPFFNSSKLFRNRDPDISAFVMIISMSWFYIVSFVWHSLLNDNFKNQAFKILLLISAIFITITAIVSPITRRIMYVYPFIYSYFIISVTTYSYKKILNIFIKASLLYISLLIIYFLLEQYYL